MTDLFTHVALPFAIVCLAAWPLARRKSDTYRAPTSADVAVTVLDFEFERLAIAVDRFRHHFGVHLELLTRRGGEDLRRFLRLVGGVEADVDEGDAKENRHAKGDTQPNLALTRWIHDVAHYRKPGRPVHQGRLKIQNPGGPSQPQSQLAQPS